MHIVKQHHKLAHPSCLMDPLILAIVSPLLVALPLLLLRLLLHLHRHRQPHKNATLPPGPCPLPIIGNLHLLGTLPHRALHNLAKKYGPIMALWLGNVPAIVISSPEMAKLVLNTHDTVLSGRPQMQVTKYLTYGNRDILSSQYGPYWRSVRKVSTLHLLSPSKVRSFGPMREEEVGRMVARIKAAVVAGETVDVTAEVGKVIGEMGSKMILGCTSTERANLGSLIHEVLNLSGAFNIADYVPLLAPLDLQGLTKRLKVVQNAFDAVLEDIVNENEQKLDSDNRGNFIDTLLSMIDKPFNGNGEVPFLMERSNIKAIILDMILGSYDTSSTAIGWAMLELMRNTHVMAHLQKELQTVIGIDRMVEEIDLPKLSYLEMVVKETLRLHPVGPLLVPHESVEDVTLSRYYVPKKSRIIINAWAIGRDQSVWSDNADEFFPERFIGSDIDFKAHNFQLIPFGSGRRACPGMLLGLTTFRLILAQLAHCFTWELLDGMSPEDLDMTEEFGLSTPSANHLLLKPTYRLHTSKSSPPGNTYHAHCYFFLYCFLIALEKNNRTS